MLAATTRPLLIQSSLLFLSFLILGQISLQYASRIIPPWYATDSGTPPANFRGFIRSNIHGLNMGRKPSTNGERTSPCETMYEQIEKMPYLSRSPDAPDGPAQPRSCSRTAFYDPSYIASYDYNTDPYKYCQYAYDSAFPPTNMAKTKAETGKDYFEFPFVAVLDKTVKPNTDNEPSDESIERFIRMALARMNTVRDPSNPATTMTPGYHYFVTSWQETHVGGGSFRADWGCASLDEMFTLIEEAVVDYQPPLFLASYAPADSLHPMEPRIVPNVNKAARTVTALAFTGAEFIMPPVFGGTALSHPWHRSLDFSDFMGTLAFNGAGLADWLNGAADSNPLSMGLDIRRLTKTYIKGK
jgi:hypothetical protein